MVYTVQFEIDIESDEVLPDDLVAEFICDTFDNTSAEVRNIAITDVND